MRRARIRTQMYVCTCARMHMYVAITAAIVARKRALASNKPQASGLKSNECSVLRQACMFSACMLECSEVTLLIPPSEIPPSERGAAD